MKIYHHSPKLKGYICKKLRHLITMLKKYFMGQQYLRISICFHLSSKYFHLIMWMLSLFLTSLFYFLLLQLEALAHPFFDELREPNARLPNGRPLPSLFNFKQEVYLSLSFIFLFFFMQFWRSMFGTCNVDCLDLWEPTSLFTSNERSTLILLIEEIFGPQLS